MMAMSAVQAIATEETNMEQTPVMMLTMPATSRLRCRCRREQNCALLLRSRNLYCNSDMESLQGRRWSCNAALGNISDTWICVGSCHVSRSGCPDYCAVLRRTAPCD